jgi:hypothetical protein
MKRNELVDKLVSEGLSEKTLSKLTDNQLNILSSRMLGEQIKKGNVVVPTNTDPNKIKQLTGQGLDVALGNKPTTEGDVTENLKGNQKNIDKNHNGKIDGQDFKILNGQKKKEVKEDTYSDEGHIEYGGHEIPVYTSGESKMFGHPRKKGDRTPPSFGYGENRLSHLKKAIDKFNGDNTNGDKSFPKERLQFNEELKGNQKKIDANHNDKIDGQDFKILKGQKKAESKKCEDCGKEIHKCSCDDSHLGESKPSAGLSKEKKSEVVKKAKSGGDIGKKGKGFEKLANKAAKEYGSKEAGQKVAAASMWKNIHESNSELNAKRNLHFELKEAGVSDVDLESKDINELAERHSKNSNVKNAHEFYKRVSDKTMNIAGKMNETKDWVNNLVENEYFHNFTSKNEIMNLIQTKLNESDTMVQHGSKVKKGHNGIPEFMTYDAIAASAAEPSKAPAEPTVEPGTKPSEPGIKPKHPYGPGRPDKEPNIKPKPKAQMREDKNGKK